MPVPQIPMGVVTQMVQNEVWALPSGLCHVSASAALELSFTGSGGWVADPGSPGPAAHVIGAPFIRCPGGAATVIAHRAT